MNAALQNKDDVDSVMEDLGNRARRAARDLAKTPPSQKNTALISSADQIRTKKDYLMKQNRIDLDAGKEKKLNAALLDRLALTDDRIEAMAKGLEAIATMADPIGTIIAEWDRPNGLRISRVRTPLGVIGVIYESRPNVTADAGALCLKSGNTCILRGGSESYHSSRAILECLQDGLKIAALSGDYIQMVPTKDRAAVGKMLTMTKYIDVIVPRGGKALTERIMQESRIPTFQHLVGLCHTYIHGAADPVKALTIAVNAKMRRPGICGATETILVDQSLTDTLTPTLVDNLLTAGCEVRGDEGVSALDNRVKAATPEDWDTEYLDSIVAIKIVSGIDEAISHIIDHSSDHTESIITEDMEAAERFMDEVPSAIVMHNTSTQFADGGEFGMGAEIGIATGKLHARGPVGVEQLTTFKYKVRGNGQTRT